MLNSYHHTLLVIGQLAFVAVLAYLFLSAHRTKLGRRHELSKQVLEKMSSQEFLDLLRSPEGQESIGRLLGTHKSPGEWATEAVRRAILLLCAGPALLVVYRMADFSGREILLVMGSLSVAVGIGDLVAATLTRRRERRIGSDPAP